MERTHRQLAVLLVFAITQLATLPAYAEPGTDEHRAGLCAAYEGVAFTFCVALCEARECDRLGPGDPRCVVLRRGFTRVTGVAPPCDAGALAYAPRPQGS